jgi:hypothetical protein
VPLLLTVLIVYPAFEGHPIRWSRLGEDLLLATEAARWAGFGIALHVVLPTIAGSRKLPSGAAGETDDSQGYPRPD